MRHKEVHGSAGVHIWQNENATLAGVVFLSILFPIILPHQQIVLGSAVNALLYTSALLIKSKKAYVPAVIPSSVVAALALLFARKFIIPLLPVIWLGNATLIFLTRHFGKDAKAMGIAAIVKPIVMGIGTSLLIAAGIVPTKMLVPFFALQLITAMLGALFVASAKTLYAFWTKRTFGASR